MRSLLIVVGVAGLWACESNNECVTPKGCGPEMLCVANRCVGSEVEGDTWTLYLEEFRLRLDTDCGICHFAGANEAGVERGDGSWRLHSGARLSLEQIEASYLDVREFLAPGDPQLTAFVAYARGLSNVELEGEFRPHPTIWGSKENLSYLRTLNWLALFPDATAPAEPPPEPPMIQEPGGGFEGYQTLHPVLAAGAGGCSCHVSDTYAWQIAAGDVEGEALVPSFESTRGFIAPGDPDGSDLLKWARGELGAHPPIWTVESEGHGATAEWIRKTTP